MSQDSAAIIMLSESTSTTTGCHVPRKEATKRKPHHLTRQGSFGVSTGGSSTERSTKFQIAALGQFLFHQSVPTGSAFYFS
eukprot:6172737-Pleurochrysis_carterae.AAC.1